MTWLWVIGICVTALALGYGQKIFIGWLDGNPYVFPKYDSEG